MDAVFGVFRGFMGPDASEQEKQLDVFRGLFGGMPTDAVKRFVNDSEERAVRQRHDVVPALREASERRRSDGECATRTPRARRSSSTPRGASSTSRRTPTRGGRSSSSSRTGRSRCCWSSRAGRRSSCPPPCGGCRALGRRSSRRCGGRQSSVSRTSRRLSGEFRVRKKTRRQIPSSCEHFQSPDRTSSSKKKPPLRRHSVGERRRMGADDPGDELTAHLRRMNIS